MHIVPTIAHLQGTLSLPLSLAISVVSRWFSTTWHLNSCTILFYNLTDHISNWLARSLDGVIYELLQVLDF